MTHLSTNEELKEKTLTLAGIKESPTPFVSCYLNLENGEKSVLQTIELRAKPLRQAGKNDYPVEVVDHSDNLMERGGIGCRLLFRASL